MAGNVPKRVLKQSEVDKCLLGGTRLWKFEEVRIMYTMYCMCVCILYIVVGIVVKIVVSSEVRWSSVHRTLMHNLAYTNTRKSYLYDLGYACTFVLVSDTVTGVPLCVC